MQNKINRSFLKWMGGKGRVIPQLLQYLPKGERLIEPFIGGGNVFINTATEKYIIADSNHDLINVYRWLKDDLATLYNTTQALFDSENDFYDIRNQFNQPKHRYTVKLAAQFIWLNRHCFNGICRYNKSGKFNVPQGKHKNIYFPGEELINFSNKLLDTDVEIYACGFASAIQLADDGDVIYCDPPYLSKHKDSFVGYTPNGFDCSQTRELEICLVEAVKRGSTAVISNFDNSATREILHRFKIYEIEAPRTVAANGNRKPAKEIIGVLTPDMV